MRWAVIAHPDQWIRGRLVVAPKKIAEACLPAAVAQGWIVLARDSDLTVPPTRLSHRMRWREHGYGFRGDV